MPSPKRNGHAEHQRDWASLIFQAASSFLKEFAKAAAKTLASRPVVLMLLSMFFYLMKQAVALFVILVLRHIQ